jgi:hypothetical protein
VNDRACGRRRRSDPDDSETEERNADSPHDETAPPVENFHVASNFGVQTPDRIA